MAVFTWKPHMVPLSDDNDEFQTEFYEPPASCHLCGEAFTRGQRVMAFRAQATLILHAGCVKENARGLLKDIAECTR
jgi:hypothetical protein